MYYIKDVGKDLYYTYTTKERFLQEVAQLDINDIGHNENDTYRATKGYWRTIGEESYWVEYHSKESIRFILYENDTVLNKFITKAEATLWVEYETAKRDRRYKKKILYGHYFEYRKDPVPHIRCHWGGRYYRKIKRGKREYILMLDLNVKKGRIANKKYLVKSWGDDHIRCYSKSWKDNKKRKQWM